VKARKAPGPATTKSRKPRRGDRFAGRIAADAIKRCLGFLLPRGKQGIEAFNIDTQSLGVFPDMKSAADAVSAQAVSR
jgi:hypothetical protein